MTGDCGRNDCYWFCRCVSIRDLGCYTRLDPELKNPIAIEFSRDSSKMAIVCPDIKTMIEFLETIPDYNGFMDVRNIKTGRYLIGTVSVLLAAARNGSLIEGLER